MRNIILVAFVLVVNIVFAQDNTGYTIQEKFVFNSVELLDSKTYDITDSFEDCGGVVIRVKIGDKEHLAIGLPGVMNYELVVMKTIKKKMDDDVSIIDYQCAGQFENKAYAADVVFTYEQKKNKETPSQISLCIYNSPIIQKFKGLIKLDK